MDIDGNRHYQEKCEEHSFAFARFYNEIACLSGMVKQINDYSKVFGEKLMIKERFKGWFMDIKYL